jgi:hypothetical protein
MLDPPFQIFALMCLVIAKKYFQKPIWHMLELSYKVFMGKVWISYLHASEMRVFLLFSISTFSLAVISLNCVLY